ncbi:MAG: hypothetical protein HYV27_02990 [Candidatus Hydrogenedentes bacterium]|nr:hypothetical protein [Candidatus Hydrogenedentota bacterium]
MPHSDERQNTGFFESRIHRRVFTKYAVALRAAALLREGDAILIDAGTSLTPIAKIIGRIADQPEQKWTHYTIMTHNNAAFDPLSNAPPNARLNVFQTGGRYDRDLNASFGHQAEMAYLQYHPRWVFIGQNGIEADLGLFCHGNTEELALKREIFAMPAWGRVIVADFTKIGSPGGLVFGASENLTTNVNVCVIVTDDPHDGQFRPPESQSTSYTSGRSPRTASENFENQVQLLKETYESCVLAVHFRVHNLTKKENGGNTSEIKYEDAGYVDPKSSEILRLNCQRVEGCYRIHLTKDDTTNKAPFKPEFDIATSLAYVDLEVKNDESIEVLQVELFWDDDGVPKLQREAGIPGLNGHENPYGFAGC